MANFGTRLAYPTPDWVAYRTQERDASPRQERSRARRVGATMKRALQRLVRAWVEAHNSNAYRWPAP